MVMLGVGLGVTDMFDPVAVLLTPTYIVVCTCDPKIVRLMGIVATKDEDN